MTQHEPRLPVTCPQCGAPGKTLTDDGQGRISDLKELISSKGVYLDTKAHAETTLTDKLDEAIEALKQAEIELGFASSRTTGTTAFSRIMGLKTATRGIRETAEGVRDE